MLEIVWVMVAEGLSTWLLRVIGDDLMCVCKFGVVDIRIYGMRKRVEKDERKQRRNPTYTRDTHWQIASLTRACPTRARGGSPGERSKGTTSGKKNNHGAWQRQSRRRVSAAKSPLVAESRKVTVE